MGELVFEFRPEKAQAYGRPLDGKEFLVLKDSTAMRRGSPNVKRDEDDRDRLLRQGVLFRMSTRTGINSRGITFSLAAARPQA